MKKNLTLAVAVLCMTVLLLAHGAPAFAQDENHKVGEITLNPEDAKNIFKKPGYSPYPDRNFPTRVYFGDTHLHTSVSTDAFGFGNMLSPEDGYRFARGEIVRAATGDCVWLSRPLDFVVVADHAESYGTMIEVYRGNPNLLTDPTLRRWHQMLNAGSDEAFKAISDWPDRLLAGTLPEAMLNKGFFRTQWCDHVELTDPDFDPDHTAFYYVHVLQIPTPRYSLLDAIALQMDYRETGQPATIQERA